MLNSLDRKNIVKINVFTEEQKHKEELKSKRYHPELPTIDEIIYAISIIKPKADLAIIEKAYKYAEAAHAGQLRLSGAPYLMHPANVALLLAEMGFDEYSIISGLLHDTVEDTEAYIEDIETEFSSQVADIVDGVTKITVMNFDTKEEQQAENIRKMILAMSQDIRVPIVKLVDRMHNMSTLEFQKPEKQLSISKETMDIYAPLANRLGLHRIKLELEDMSFRYLVPDSWQLITDWLDQNKMEERQVIGKVISKLEEILKENSISGRVFGRIKHKYSIYKKMNEQKTNLDEMHDIIAFRVLVKDLKDCYAVLGFVHSMWRPITSRFKDYISTPKANGYQSLHTTVIGPEGERLEVQIRTEEMHSLAEHGVAAHWLYKERDHDVQKAPQLQWIRDLLDRQKDEADSKEFMQSLKLDLFNDEIYVFTPSGEVKELPVNSTPVDFAYLIHTQLGSQCAGAKINGKITPLSTPLKSGDIVEIICDKNKKPNRDWLKFVKTSRARSKIQNYLNTKERALAIQLGKEMIEKEARRLGINLNKSMKDGSFALIIDDFNLASADDLFSNVGYAQITPRKVLNRYLELQGKEIKDDEKIQDIKSKEYSKESAKIDKPDNSIVIQGQNDLLVGFAKCCSPLPGDLIIGYISKGRGITVHTHNCPHIQELESERLISVSWSNQEDTERPFPVRIDILCKKQKGALYSITKELVALDIVIEALLISSNVDMTANIDMTIEAKNTVHLYQIMDRLRKLDVIIEITRNVNAIHSY